MSVLLDSWGRYGKLARSLLTNQSTDDKETKANCNLSKICQASCNIYRHMVHWLKKHFH